MKDPVMYIRYLGSKACWTVPGGRFYIGGREELSDEERSVCEGGGGDRRRRLVIFVAGGVSLEPRRR